jgi:hypothetical protein
MRSGEIRSRRGRLGDASFTGKTRLTVSVLVAISITAFFAFVFDAPPSLVLILLALTFFTAVLEHVLHTDIERRR